MSEDEFNLLLRAYQHAILTTEARRARVALLRAALDLHLAQQISIFPFFALHSISPLAYKLLLSRDEQEQIAEEFSLYPESLPDFLLRKHEIRPDDSYYERALALILPMRQHRNELHIPLRTCKSCWGELVACALARQIRRGSRARRSGLSQNPFVRPAQHC